MPLIKRPGKPTLHYQVDDHTDPRNNAPVILLQHGFGRSSQFWYSSVPYRARLYKVVRPDLRGLGALSKHMRKLPQQLRRSLSWDRGKEMADHKHFTLATHVRVYFCDPHSLWRRGSNENTNGLLRQYFPKGTDLSRHSQAHLNKIALRLYNVPGKPSPSKRLPTDHEPCCIDRLNPPLITVIPARLTAS